jgi:hypothetical protein
MDVLVAIVILALVCWAVSEQPKPGQELPRFHGAIRGKLK